jgi:hypothetical protein
MRINWPPTPIFGYRAITVAYGHEANIQGGGKTFHVVCDSVNIYICPEAQKGIVQSPLPPHCKDSVPKIAKKNSQKRNCAASVPISTFIYLLAIYILPRSVCLFGCSKTDRPILRIQCINRSQMCIKIEIGNKAAQFDFLEYKFESSLQCTTLFPS